MLKKILKRTFQLLLLAFIVIQFIRPAKNISEGISNNDISKIYAVPADVQAILKTSCYDCHSNNTVYPWYANIQPAAWWLADHVKEGKKELNFSEFASYRIGRQYRKLEEINKEVKENEMPLESYLWIHKDSKLSEQQKLTLANWVTTIRDTIKANYPSDSLVRKK
ncbi:MAG: heme-binding domain-containing protein [Chitinophagaceae bacterium]|nr:heme-binding domain-containing protein [Chitinophagaceae bacterium]MBL0198667.1 heme-binding domain-containing protein [Chitinophagaceae bacterium]